MRVWLTSLALSIAFVASASDGQAKPAAKKPAATKPAAKKSAAKKPAAKKPAAEKADGDGASSDEKKPPATEESADQSESSATELNSPAMLGVGVAFTIVGTAGVVGGVTLAYRREENLPFVHFSPALPIAGIAGGSALILAGIPLWIAGAWEVPSEPEKTEPDKEKSAVRVLPIVGLTGGGLRGTF